MMLDANVVACSAATVDRVLSDAGLLRRNLQRSSKGTGFHQPLVAHEHWHFIRLCGMKHVRTSPYYPQSNGKIERYHRTIKSDCIRMLSPLCLEDAKRGVEKYVLEYNTLRLHSAIGYVTPTAMREGRQQAIFDERDRKLEQALALRARTRAAKTTFSFSCGRFIPALFAPPVSTTYAEPIHPSNHDG